MGKRGPKPTPTAVLEKRGSWRAVERDGEPVPDGLDAPPDPPKGMTGRAAEVWRDSAARMVGIGTLTEEDLATFERYCRAYALWTKKAEEADAADEITEGMTKALVNLDNQLRRLEAAFGKNPADRSAIKLPEKRRTNDPFQKPKLKAG